MAQPFSSAHACKGPAVVGTTAAQAQAQAPETSLVWLAARDGTCEDFSALLAAWPQHLNCPGRDQLTPLNVACVHGNTEVVRILLGHAAVDPNLKDVEGDTPISNAAAHGHLEITILLLLGGRVDVNKDNYCGQTPLWRACWHGNLPMVQALLGSRRDFDTTRCTNNLYWSPRDRHTSAAQIAERKATAADSATEAADFREIARLVRDYEANAHQTRERIRSGIGWTTWEAEVFAQVVFLCEDLLDLKAPATTKEANAVRFFKLAKNLHCDLQFLLTLRAAGKTGNLIPFAQRRMACIALAKAN